MELLFSCLSRYQEIIAVYILLLDTLLVRCSPHEITSWIFKDKFHIKAHPSIYSLFIEWVQNSRVCHTASIQNPLKVTTFNEFQCVTVVRSLNDRFSYSPAIIDCWPQKKVVDECKGIKLVNKCSRKLHIWADMHGQLPESRLLLKQ